MNSPKYPALIFVMSLVTIIILLAQKTTEVQTDWPEDMPSYENAMFEHIPYQNLWNLPRKRCL